MTKDIYVIENGTRSTLDGYLERKNINRDIREIIREQQRYSFVTHKHHRPNGFSVRKDGVISTHNFTKEEIRAMEMTMCDKIISKLVVNAGHPMTTKEIANGIGPQPSVSACLSLVYKFLSGYMAYEITKARSGSGVAYTFLGDCSENVEALCQQFKEWNGNRRSAPGKNKLDDSTYPTQPVVSEAPTTTDINLNINVSGEVKFTFSMK
jgi:hypothetical protein